jgi:hypothetical protein
MSTITVSAGRNVGDAPMDAVTWETFTMDLVATVEATGHTVLFEGTGQGIWEGTVEQAFTIVAASGPEARTGTLAEWLGAMARHYGQDAIAITVGTTVLAGMQHSTSV